ncbi:hypothetical protein LZ31DRAFT_349787 [Colletotrichum somersetense]|nr:hypothetical protein LZ31DRAFT_349787 [Colletotrichum somersetense]
MELGQSFARRNRDREPLRKRHRIVGRLGNLLRITDGFPLLYFLPPFHFHLRQAFPGMTPHLVILASGKPLVWPVLRGGYILPLGGTSCCLLRPLGKTAELGSGLRTPEGAEGAEGWWGLVCRCSLKGFIYPPQTHTSQRL